MESLTLNPFLFIELFMECSESLKADIKKLLEVAEKLEIPTTSPIQVKSHIPYGTSVLVEKPEQIKEVPTPLPVYSLISAGGYTGHFNGYHDANYAIVIEVENPIHIVRFRISEKPGFFGPFPYVGERIYMSPRDKLYVGKEVDVFLQNLTGLDLKGCRHEIVSKISEHAMEEQVFG